ncbi:MAG TPA: metal-dependent hydrolase [Candidatus Limnocylindrales bacterium]|jgi:membrane-bound metal-dependent hydrolase YbcI (DUF457 family)|nr:metal-dependent hydrolase [Candidatus Limnocylindrales bacterium]
MDVIWAAAFAGIYFSLRRYRAGAWVVAVGVVSHWLLDWWSHRPDMPLTPWSQQKYGLGLWNSVGGTLAAELILFFGGLFIYLSVTKSRDRTGTAALWALVILLVAIWLGNVFGSPPPSVQTIMWLTYVVWLIVAWAYWIDRHREVRARRVSLPRTLHPVDL